jgi:hypothetical protein
MAAAPVPVAVMTETEEDRVWDLEQLIGEEEVVEVRAWARHCIFGCLLIKSSNRYTEALYLVLHAFLPSSLVHWLLIRASGLHASLFHISSLQQRINSFALLRN